MAVLVEDVAAFLNATISQNTLEAWQGARFGWFPGWTPTMPWVLTKIMLYDVLVLHDPSSVRRTFVSHGCRRPFPATK